MTENDKLSEIIWDSITLILYIGVRAAAVCYGVIGIVTDQVELTANGILLYLISNNLEKIMDERLGRKDEVN